MVSGLRNVPAAIVDAIPSFAASFITGRAAAAAGRPAPAGRPRRPRRRRRRRPWA